LGNVRTGALEYRECVGEDIDVKRQVPFPHLINSTPDESVVLAWIVFKSRAHRDEGNAKVMKNPRLVKIDLHAMPFDCKRMTYGGFEVLVDAIAPQWYKRRQPRADSSGNKVISNRELET
jgi:uncharacterized protein YbaA (DUF1428 family)